MHVHILAKPHGSKVTLESMVGFYQRLKHLFMLFIMQRLCYKPCGTLLLQLMLHIYIYECLFKYTLQKCQKFVFKIFVLTEAPKLAHETFRAIKPGLSAYADNPEKVTSKMCSSFIIVNPSQMPQGCDSIFFVCSLMIILMLFYRVRKDCWNC